MSDNIDDALLAEEDEIADYDLGVDEENALLNDDDGYLEEPQDNDVLDLEVETMNEDEDIDNERQDKFSNERSQPTPIIMNNQNPENNNKNFNKFNNYRGRGGQRGRGNQRGTNHQNHHNQWNNNAQQRVRPQLPKMVHVNPRFHARVGSNNRPFSKPTIQVQPWVQPDVPPPPLNYQAQQQQVFVRNFAQQPIRQDAQFQAPAQQYQQIQPFDAIATTYEMAPPSFHPPQTHIQPPPPRFHQPPRFQPPQFQNPPPYQPAPPAFQPQQFNAPHQVNYKPSVHQRLGIPVNNSYGPPQNHFVPERQVFQSYVQPNQTIPPNQNYNNQPPFVPVNQFQQPPPPYQNPPSYNPPVNYQIQVQQPVNNYQTTYQQPNVQPDPYIQPQNFNYQPILQQEYQNFVETPTQNYNQFPTNLNSYENPSPIMSLAGNIQVTARVDNMTPNNIQGGKKFKTFGNQNNKFRQGGANNFAHGHSPTKRRNVDNQQYDNNKRRSGENPNLHTVPVEKSLFYNVVPVAAVEEDAETKAYRQKIEEQKLKREQILATKEMRRKHAAAKQQAEESLTQINIPLEIVKVEPEEHHQQQQQIVEVKVPQLMQLKVPKPNTITRHVIAPQTNTNLKLVNATNVFKVIEDDKGGNISSFLSNRKVFVKDASLADTSTVVVSNLSAGTTEIKLRKLCQGVGDIQNFELSTKERQATITFKSVASAHAFFKKYQRFMLDLSMIQVILKPLPCN